MQRLLIKFPDVRGTSEYLEGKITPQYLSDTTRIPDKKLRLQYTAYPRVCLPTIFSSVVCLQFQESLDNLKKKRQAINILQHQNVIA